MMMLSSKRITKALVSQRLCCSHVPEDRVSHIEAHITMGMEKAKFNTCPGTVNGRNILVQRIFYFSERTDNAQRTLRSPYCSETIYMYKHFENSVKLDMYSIESSVDPDQKPRILTKQHASLNN